MELLRITGNNDDSDKGYVLICFNSTIIQTVEYMHVTRHPAERLKKSCTLLHFLCSANQCPRKLLMYS